MTKIIRLLVACIGLFLGLAAQASTVKIWHEAYQPNYFPSAEAGCQAKHGSYYSRVDYPNPDIGQCVYWDWDYSTTEDLNDKKYYYGAQMVAIYQTCPGDQVPSYPSGACTNPPPPDEEPPPPPDSCKAGAPYSRTWARGRSDESTMPMPSCDAGCAISVDSVDRCYTEPESSDPEMRYCTFTVHKVGGACSNPDAPDGQAPNPDGTSAPVPPMTPTDGKCPAGTTMAGMDSSGTPICMGSGTAPKAPVPPPPVTTEPPVTTSNPDGSTTVTETSKKTNSDGSVTTTTTTTTTGTDGSVSKNTTVVVGNTPLGDKGRDTPDPSDEKYDLCKQHPELNICRNSTVGGACETIHCTGDAIQCATLREAAQIQCRQKRTEEELLESGLHAVGASAVAGTDLDGLPTMNSAVQFNVDTQLSQAGFLGGGACFSDKTVTIQGHTITLPFSAACEYLIVFRYVVMIIAGFISFRLLSTATLKD